MPTQAEVYNSIDWTPFEGMPPMRCTCRCGATYPSQGKCHLYKGTLYTVTKEPCPGCGQHHDCRAMESTPEVMTIRGPQT